MMSRDDGRLIGLARALSKMGCCSRSRAAELIRAGRVRLNGAVRRDPEAPVRPSDAMEVNGRPAAASQRIYLAFNKPRGIITTACDEKGRGTVYDRLPAELPWVAPVGRLDKASEGLLLLTNDSEWAARITAPESHLDKTYHVQINSIVTAQDLQRMMRGVRTKAGETLHVKSARVLREGERRSWLLMVLDEGKNRQIRRLLDAMGIDVLRLVRAAIGPLELGDLAKGAHRRLTDQEKQRIDRAIKAGMGGQPQAPLL